MKILHVVPSLNVETGGPARSVSTLADAQALAGMETTVLCLDYERHGRLIEPERAKLVSMRADALTRFLRGWSPAFAALARRLAREHDIVHNHGIWMQVNRHARLAATAAERPLIISPRGMLEAYSWQRSAWRKRLAMHAFESRNFAAASLFHATADSEALSIRRLLPSARIAVLPNLVELTPARSADHPGSRVLLFLGRIDHKKGLDWLLDAWDETRSIRDGWRLKIAGPCNLGFEPTFQTLRDRTSDDGSVEWLGALDGADKQRALASADVVVLPSRSENFGNVILEAMFAGRPCLATDATPWSALASEQLGWYVGATKSGILDGLKQIFITPPMIRAEMGRRSQTYAQRNFSAAAISQQWQEVYEHTLGRAGPPDCFFGAG